MRIPNSPWLPGMLAFGWFLGAATTYPLPKPAPKATQLDRIEGLLDTTADFLSDIHAERSACK